MVSHNSLGCLFFTVFLLCNYFPTNYAQLDDAGQPELTITQGTLVGTTVTTRHGRNVSAFLRIPFAQPPTGDLRFANPVAADNWNGTLDASIDRNMCPQIGTDGIVGEEDCLYLKVFTPQLPQNTNESLLPVMVFIFGGAFAGEYPENTSPTYLLDADVVLVVVNYRLGPLGFLSTGDEVASGNWGLKDQVLALKWVQDNVHFFGGNPDEVTIFGESAGACSVHLLTLSNTTTGLFNKFITQSGSALATWAYRPRAAYSSLAFELGEYVGCNNETSDSLITCLRSLEFSDIIATQPQFQEWGFVTYITWGPTDEPDIEGAFLTDSPSNVIAAQGIRDLPWMAGVVRDEGLMVTPGIYENEEYLNEFLENFDIALPAMSFWTYQSDLGAAWTNATKSYYFNDDLTSNTSVLLENLTMLVGDTLFNYPTYKALRQHHALAVTPQYLYSFNYRGSCSLTYLMNAGSTTNYGVTHGDDLIYLFPLESDFEAVNRTMSEEDYEMVDTLVQLWTSFAINGTPTVSSLNGTATWEPYSTEEAYLRIGNESDLALEVQYSFLEERMQFWSALDAATETQDESGTATSTPNLLFLIPLVCSTFFISAGIVHRSY